MAKYFNTKQHKLYQNLSMSLFQGELKMFYAVKQLSSPVDWFMVWLKGTFPNFDKWGLKPRPYGKEWDVLAGVTGPAAVVFLQIKQHDVPHPIRCWCHRLLSLRGLWKEGGKRRKERKVGDGGISSVSSRAPSPVKAACLHTLTSRRHQMAK